MYLQAEKAAFDEAEKKREEEPKLVLKTSTSFNLMMDSMNRLHSSILEISRDATENGKLLRLKQQFFLCSASLQDMIVRFRERKDGKSSWQWSEFPNKVAVQLNDTHPTLAIPELMRLLMDDDGLGWDEAWDMTTRHWRNVRKLLCGNFFLTIWKSLKKSTRGL